MNQTHYQPQYYQDKGHQAPPYSQIPSSIPSTYPAPPPAYSLNPPPGHGIPQTYSQPSGGGNINVNLNEISGNPLTFLTNMCYDGEKLNITKLVGTVVALIVTICIFVNLTGT